MAAEDVLNDFEPDHPRPISLIFLFFLNEFREFFHVCTICGWGDVFKRLTLRANEYDFSKLLVGGEMLDIPSNASISIDLRT